MFFKQGLLISTIRFKERNCASEMYYILKKYLEVPANKMKLRPTGVSGLVMAALYDNNILEIAEKLKNLIQKPGFAMFPTRVVPIEKVVPTSIDEIVGGLTKINASERLTDKKWRITIRKRYAQEVDRQELIQKVASAIGDVGTVNLTDYDLELRIEILSQETGLSIIPPDLDVQIKQPDFIQD
ncbi:MAG: THUMP domain-containing protein [Candidatus Kariarchaeaceae archaeon]